MQMRKLRLRETLWLPRVMWLVSVRTRESKTQVILTAVPAIAILSGPIIQARQGSCVTSSGLLGCLCTLHS